MEKCCLESYHKISFGGIPNSRKVYVAPCNETPWNLAEACGTFRNLWQPAPKPSRRHNGNLHNPLEPSGTLWNLPPEPTPAHTRTLRNFRNLPEPSRTCVCQQHQHELVELVDLASSSQVAPPRRLSGRPKVDRPHIYLRTKNSETPKKGVCLFLSFIIDVFGGQPPQSSDFGSLYATTEPCLALVAGTLAGLRFLSGAPKCLCISVNEAFEPGKNDRNHKDHALGPEKLGVLKH